MHEGQDLRDQVIGVIRKDGRVCHGLRNEADRIDGPTAAKVRKVSALSPSSGQEPFGRGVPFPMNGVGHPMNLMQAIKGRRAVTSYVAKPVPRDVILDLIDAAAAAPSAMNLQPWSFAVVEGARRLAAMSTSAKRLLLSTHAAETSLATHRDLLEDPSFNIFYGAPCLVVVCARPPSRQATEDCCLAAQNLMLAAHGRGLGSCWIGFSRPWLELPQTRASLGLLPDQIPVAPIVVGEPAFLPDAPGRHRPAVIWCTS